jgi:hypothetical protein
MLNEIYNKISSFSQKVPLRGKLFCADEKLKKGKPQTIL